MGKRLDFMWNKSEKQRLYGFIYMWHIRNNAEDSRGWGKTECEEIREGDGPHETLDTRKQN